MRQVLIKKGQVLLDVVPAPFVDEGCVLVETAYSVISTGTELSSVEQSGKSLAQRAVEQPDRIRKLLEHLQKQGIQKTLAKVRGLDDTTSPTGYSCSGVVAQIGNGVTDIHVGDRVACAGAGYANHAELVVVPRNLVARVPEGCELREAAAATIGAIALQGVRRATPTLGETVAVIGLGLLGQITVQLLKANGCHVIGIDLDARRTNLACSLGADFAFSPAEANTEIKHCTADHGVDATIITAASSSDAIVQQAMQITRKKGRVVVVGAVGLGLKRSPFYEKEIDLLISCSYGPGRYDPQYEEGGVDYPYSYVRWTENRNMEAFLQLIADGKVNLSTIIEKEYDLVQAPLAYESLQASADKPLAAILRYPAAHDTETSPKYDTKVILHSSSPKNKIRIAVVGAGSFAKSVHLPNLRKLSDQYHIQAIVSATGSNAKATAQQFGANYATTNYADVLNDPNIDAVLICTRHHLHAQQSLQAANAGKAVLLEKPMALNQQELECLERVLRETNVPFMVGFNRRFSPAARRAKEIVAGRHNPVMILYRMNAGYLPPAHWTQTTEGGGRIIGEACHIFDLFRFIVDAPPIEVTATRLTPKSEHVLTVDNVTATLRYMDGSVATLLYTSLGSVDLAKEYMELYVDGKVVVIDDYDVLRIHGSHRSCWQSATQDKGHLEELKAFANHINGLTEAPIPLEELIQATKTSLAVAGINDAAS